MNVRVKRPTVGQTFFARRKRRLAMQKTISTCALISIAAFAAPVGFATRAQAQHIPPYHGPGAEGQYSHGNHHQSGRLEFEHGQTFGQPGGKYIGGPYQSGSAQSGPAAPSYWTY